MGTLTSKQSRRISFDNTFALKPLLVSENRLNDENILYLPNSVNSEEELAIQEKLKRSESREDADYWDQRVNKLKREHAEINKIINTEYEKTFEKTSKYFAVPEITPEKINKVQPCVNIRTKIMQCYEDNPRQPLVCSTLVQAFSNCVANSRMDV